jgi:hypothetical protein
VFATLLLVFSLASKLEIRLFKGRAFGFVISLALGAVALHVPGWWLKVRSTLYPYFECPRRSQHWRCMRWAVGSRYDELCTLV